MKKVFVDIYLAFNFGDDLFLDIVAKKYPACKFTINYLGTGYDEFISRYDNLYRRKYTMLNKLLQHLKIIDYITEYRKVAEDHDALIFIGGSIFREEDYHSSLYADRLRLVNEFKKLGKPIFILGANFGPFKSKDFFNDYREFFKMCDDVCFRDTYSFELFKDLPQVRYAPDIVFQMDLRTNGLTAPTKRVGFSIIDVRHKQGLARYYDDYIISTAKTVNLLAGKGYECHLISFCKKEGDLQSINTIVSHLSAETKRKTFIYNYEGNLTETIDLIATFDLLIAARFHANVAALLLGIGVMPIIYSEKTSNMLKDLKCDDCSIKMEELHLQYDEKTLDLAFNNRLSLSSVREGAKKQFAKLEEFFWRGNEKEDFVHDYKYECGWNRKSIT